MGHPLPPAILDAVHAADPFVCTKMASWICEPETVHLQPVPCRGEIVGYSPAGLAAAAASGLAILGVARALVQHSAASQADAQ